MRGCGSLLLYVGIPLALIIGFAVWHSGYSGKKAEKKAQEDAKQKQEQIESDPRLYAKHYVRERIHKPGIDDDGNVLFRATVQNSGVRTIRSVTFTVRPFAGKKKGQRLELSFDHLEAGQVLSCTRQIDKVSAVGFASYSYEARLKEIHF